VVPPLLHNKNNEELFRTVFFTDPAAVSMKAEERTKGIRTLRSGNSMSFRIIQYVAVKDAIKELKKDGTI